MVVELSSGIRESTCLLPPVVLADVYFHDIRICLLFLVGVNKAAQRLLRANCYCRSTTYRGLPMDGGDLIS